MSMTRQNIRVLFSAEEISQRVLELGRQLEADYSGKNPLVIGLLNGVYVFLADLTRAIDLDMQINFMRVSSYGSGQTSSGDVKIVYDTDTPIKGRHLLIVEDIVDTGQTLDKVIRRLQNQSPASIRVCTLLDKQARRIVAVPVDYVGFTISDQFVVGYGIDINGLYRNLPYIGAYSEK